MNSILQDRGYTLIETLVALTLLLLLLFLVADIMPLVTFQGKNHIKLLAINEAKKQMQTALISKNFVEQRLEINKKISMVQSVQSYENRVKITISIILNKSEQTIYQLQAYAFKNEKSGT